MWYFAIDPSFITGGTVATITVIGSVYIKCENSLKRFGPNGVLWMGGEKVTDFGELSYSQVGDLFGKTDSWARLVFYRAKKQLQEGIK